jgi:hypothetical protein
MQESSTHRKLLNHLIRPARGAMFAVLSMFSLLPGTIHERREDEAVVMDAYGSMRASNHVRSWKVLIDWLKARGDQPDDYAWLSARIVTWDDPSYISRLTEERVARLLALKRTGDALAVVAQRLTLDPRFRPKSAADTLSLAQTAARDGRASRVARALLSDFAARFEGDPRVTVAVSLSRHLSSRAPAKTFSAAAGRSAKLC